MKRNSCRLFLLFVLITLPALRLAAQEVFDDIVYEPAPITYKGLDNATTKDFAARAFDAIKNRHNKTAEELFDSILRLDKHNVLGIYGLAYCQFADGDYDKSVEILEPLINVNQNSALYSLRGRNYMALSNFEKAIPDFEKAVQGNTDDLDLLSLAECFYYSGDFTASLAQADNYLKKQPQKPVGYFVKGMAKNGSGDYAGAIEELNKVTEMDAKNSVAYYYISRNQVMMQEYNKALKSASKAIKLNQEYVEAIDLRAEIKYNVHDYPNAIFDCNRVIELDGVSQSTYLTRGKSNLKIGLKKEACADFAKAKQLGNKDAEELMGKNCK